MDLTSVIVGPVVTEKAERLKAQPRHTYTLIVSPRANKVAVKNALRRFYGVEVESVRILKVQPKTRQLGGGTVMEKRHSAKKAIVTLTPSSKALDLAAFQAKAA